MVKRGLTMTKRKYTRRSRAAAVTRRPYAQIYKQLRFKNNTHLFTRTVNASYMAGTNFAGSSSPGTLTQNSGDCVQYAIPISSLGSNYATFSMAFALSDLPDYTEFTTLFDRYKIHKVGIKIIPQSTVAQTPAGPSNYCGQILHSITDYDDNGTVSASNSGINTMREFDSYKVKQLSTKQLYFTIRPRVAMAAYGGSVFTSYANLRNIWIDANSPGVPHYGKKFAIEVLSSTGSQNINLLYKIECTYYIKCKDLR